MLFRAWLKLGQVAAHTAPVVEVLPPLIHPVAGGVISGHLIKVIEGRELIIRVLEAAVTEVRIARMVAGIPTDIIHLTGHIILIRMEVIMEAVIPTTPTTPTTVILTGIDTTADTMGVCIMAVGITELNASF